MDMTAWASAACVRSESSNEAAATADPDHHFKPVGSARGQTGPLHAGNRLAAAILVAFLAARLVFAIALGLGVDEAYTLPISRDLSLSYFDHPPLHQWIAHFAAIAFGEGVGARLPFVALFTATGWLLFRLTSELFGARAGLVALFGLNAAPFFFASAGTWIVPDGPLLFGLALAVRALGRLFFDPGEGEGRVWRLWLLAGLGFGVAGLSKYIGALTLLGLLAFLVISPTERRWFRHPAPYVAAILAALIVLPVFVWNAQHGWVSFAFQGSRGAASGALKPLQVMQFVLGQIAYLSPWLFIPLLAGLVSGMRHWRDGRRLFLLCLSIPPIVIFTAASLWISGDRPHWPMPGWFFVFPLMGAWAEDTAIPVRTLRRYAALSVALLAVLAGGVVVEARTGWLLRLMPAGTTDPTLEAFDWSGLVKAPLLQPPAAFVVSTRWMEAGKIALALGPRVPTFVVSYDPRGWAFIKGGAELVGHDGVLIARPGDLPAARAALAPLFVSLGEAEPFTLFRNGAPAVELVLVPAKGLTQPLPQPYPARPR